MKENRKTIIKTDIKKNRLVLINCYAAHMVITAKHPEEIEKFYRALDELLKSLKGKDIKILGDFNAKLGCIRGVPVGSFPRRIRNANWEMPYQILDRHKFIAVKTNFKHKASHITTWKGIINHKIIYNQIDYIAIPSCRKFSVINARSYTANKVETDHRIAAVKLHRKLGWERGEAKETRRATEDPVLIELKTKRRQNLEKMGEFKLDKLAGLKQQRNKISNAIKQRKAFLTTEEMIAEAGEITKAKKNAQAAWALKMIIKRNARTKKQKINLGKIT